MAKNVSTSAPYLACSAPRARHAMRTLSLHLRRTRHIPRMRPDVIRKQVDPRRLATGQRRHRPVAPVGHELVSLAEPAIVEGRGTSQHQSQRKQRHPRCSPAQPSCTRPVNRSRRASSCPSCPSVLSTASLRRRTSTMPRRNRAPHDPPRAAETPRPSGQQTRTQESDDQTTELPVIERPNTQTPSLILERLTHIPCHRETRHTGQLTPRHTGCYAMIGRHEPPDVSTRANGVDSSSRPVAGPITDDTESINASVPLGAAAHPRTAIRARLPYTAPRGPAPPPQPIQPPHAQPANPAPPESRTPNPGPSPGAAEAPPADRLQRSWQCRLVHR